MIIAFIFTSLLFKPRNLGNVRVMQNCRAFLWSLSYGNATIPYVLVAVNSTECLVLPRKLKNAFSLLSGHKYFIMLSKDIKVFMSSCRVPDVFSPILGTFWLFLRIFVKVTRFKLHRKLPGSNCTGSYVQWQSHWYWRTDGQTDTTNLIGTFRNVYVTVSKNSARANETYGCHIRCWTHRFRASWPQISARPTARISFHLR